MGDCHYRNRLFHISRNTTIKFIAKPNLSIQRCVVNLKTSEKHIFTIERRYNRSRHWFVRPIPCTGKDTGTCRIMTAKLMNNQLSNIC